MKKALVIQLARFGDIIQTKRLILTLLGRYDEVHLAVDSSLVPLARLVYPQLCVHGLAAHRGAGSPAEVFAASRMLFGRLASERFDAVYNLNFSRLNFSLSALFDADSVRGYAMRSGQPVVPLWARLAFRWTRKRRIAPLNLVDFWAYFARNPVCAGEVNPVAARGGGGIGVVLAGRDSRRSLPPAVLAACVQAVFEGTGGPAITLLGTAAEKTLARQLMRHFSGPMVERTVTLAGKTGYSDLAEVVGTLDTLITPDTGTMHLAAHLGTPVQAFFLSSAWCFETGPYGMGHRVWQGLVQCSPCEENRPCPVSVACLAPFADKRFLQVLAGKAAEAYPEHLSGLVSMFDAVGVTYLPVFGEDMAAPERRELRRLVAEHVCPETAKAGAGLIGLSAMQDMALQDSLGRFLFSESDWMLDAAGRDFPDVADVPGFC